MNDFWQGKKVFITGHTGFKGSWLTLWLSSLGANVKGYSLAPPTDPSLYEIAAVDQYIDSELADIRDFQRLHSSLETFKPDIVFHLAAQPLVRLSYEQPTATYSTNVMGTVNLLEAVRQVRGVRAVINVTSDKCYENKEQLIGYRESNPLGGYDPYSSSKACAEIVTAAYRRSYFSQSTPSEAGTAIATVRAGNVIGGGDWSLDRLIPDVLSAFEKGEVVNIRSPHAIRPWQYVLEALGGYMMLAERLCQQHEGYSEAWNFGPDEAGEQSVQWIIERLKNKWGQGASWSLDGELQPHEATYLKLDCAKTRERLGWQPKVSLEDTLAMIVDWHKAWSSGKDMNRYCLEEIQNYSALQ